MMHDGYSRGILDGGDNNWVLIDIMGHEIINVFEGRPGEHIEAVLDREIRELAAKIVAKSA